MADIVGSYSRVNYLLRPSKQVERKLIVEAMQRLAGRGYEISKYRYVGLGSVYYADIMLFHKYLLIDDILCVERDGIEQRMEFNKPYDFVELHIGPVSEVLPSLDRARPHLLWLDYDEPLGENELSDLSSALTVLAPGSVFLVTVTAQLMEVERAATVEEMNARKEKLVGYFGEFLGRLIPDGIKPEMLGRKKLPALFAQALRNQTLEQLGLRTDVQLEFLQVFNYLYSDGTSMLTFGGLIDSPERIQRLRNSGFLDGVYAAADPTPMLISVPPLTVREKHWLDQHLGAGEAEAPFELEAEAQHNYRRFHRYYPSYYETLL